jgi:hypothetical protein
MYCMCMIDTVSVYVLIYIAQADDTFYGTGVSWNRCVCDYIDK